MKNLRIYYNSPSLKPINNPSPDNLIYPPAGFGWLWLITAIVIFLLLIAIITPIYFLTIPFGQLRQSALWGGLTEKLVKRKYIRTLTSIDRKFRTGKIDYAAAQYYINATVRKYLILETSLPVDHMTIAEIKHSILLPALSTFELLNAARFRSPAINSSTSVNAGDIAPEIQASLELVSQWTR